MRWTTDYVKEARKDGDTREKWRFAWLPVQIKNEIIWLERYIVLQVYRVHEEKVKIQEEYFIFTVIKWVNLTKRCK